MKAKRNNPRHKVWVEDRFLKHVSKTKDCWYWTGYLIKGYGTFEGEPAHRASYRIFVGPIP